MSETPVSLVVSPSLHPDNVMTLPAFKDESTQGLLTPALDAFRTAYVGIQKVYDARAALLVDRTRTPESVMLAVGEFAEKHQSKILAKFDSAYANFTASIDSIEKTLAAPVHEDAERKSISAEVRAYCKGLSTEERFKFLDAAQARMDHVALRAVLGGPAFLAGMSPAEQANRKAQYHRINQPELAHRLKVLHDARDLLRERGSLVFDELRRAVGTDYEQIRQLRELSSKADDSLKFAA